VAVSIISSSSFELSYWSVESLARPFYYRKEDV